MFNIDWLIVKEERVQFKSEECLEDFIWHNLNTILNLTPLKRQYCSKSEYCDIICYSQTNQLCVIELKNNQDRYVVQQLTRYYDNLIDEKPFGDVVDYEKEVKLIAITPEFHRHNFIDYKYLRLKIDFYEFSIEIAGESILFYLRNAQSKEIISQIKLCARGDLTFPPSQQKTLPKPPKQFFNLVDTTMPSVKNSILEIRHKLITCHDLISEIDTQCTLKYGLKTNSNKIFHTKSLAKFYLFVDQQNINYNQLFLMLWLPCPTVKSLDSKLHSNVYKLTTYQVLIDSQSSSFNQGLSDRVDYLEIFNSDRERLDPTHNSMRRLEMKQYDSYLVKSLKDYTLNSLIDVAVEHWIGKI